MKLPSSRLTGPVVLNGALALVVPAKRVVPAPAKVAPEAIAKLRDAYLKAVNDPAIKQKLIDAGIDPLQSTPQEMADYVTAETAKWEKVIKTAGIKLD